MPQETEQTRFSAIKSMKNIIDSIIYAVFSTCPIAWMKPMHMAQIDSNWNIMCIEKMKETNVLLHAKPI
jgi:hypothetical protein